MKEKLLNLLLAYKLIIQRIKYAFDVNYWCMSSQIRYEQYYESHPLINNE